MKKFNLIILLLVIVAMISSSCKKIDELIITPQEKVVGTYNASIKVYTLDAGNLTYLATVNVSGLTVRQQNNSNNIEIVQPTDDVAGTGFTLVGTNLQNQNDDVSFDINKYTFPSGDIIIEGYDYFTMNNAMYHGSFLYSTKTFKFAVQVYEVSNPSAIRVNVYTLTK